jgi:hypothetical protein
MANRSMSRFREALAESIKTRAEFPPGVLVTLVHAEITGDSKYAKGTLSVLPGLDAVRTCLLTIKTLRACLCPKKN